MAGIYHERPVNIDLTSPLDDLPQLPHQVYMYKNKKIRIPQSNTQQPEQTETPVLQGSSLRRARHESLPPDEQHPPTKHFKIPYPLYTQPVSQEKAKEIHKKFNFQRIPVREEENNDSSKKNGLITDYFKPVENNNRQLRLMSKGNAPKTSQKGNYRVAYLRPQ